MVTVPDGRDERLDTFTNRPSRGPGEGERLLLFFFFFFSSSLVVSELLDDELLELLECALDCRDSSLDREPSLDFEAAEVLELELLVELADLLRDLTITNISSE